MTTAGTSKASTNPVSGSVVSVAYVDALREKDKVERSCVRDGKLNADALEGADWSGRRSRAGRRWSISTRYAEQSTIAWRRHKTGGQTDQATGRSATSGSHDDRPTVPDVTFGDNDRSIVDCVGSRL